MNRDTMSNKKSDKDKSADQLRSTLALGQLIAAKTPSAGSRIIADELRSLNATIKHESVALRKELATLPSRMADSLKMVVGEEQRNRRPVSQFAYRRFPVFHRPRRVSLQFGARKMIADATTSTSPGPPATKTTKESPVAAKQTATTSKSTSGVHTSVSNWLRSLKTAQQISPQDGEAGSDSDVSPQPSP